MTTDPTQGGPFPAPPGSGGRSGLRIFLYVLVGLGALLMLTCGAALFFAWQNPTIRQTLEAGLAAQTAPGAQALRDAGCGEAAVLELGGAMEALAERSRPDAELPEGVPTLFVSCQRSSAGEPLDCDRVAAIYTADVGRAPGLFVAQVTDGLSRQPVCQMVYDADGALLGSLEELVQDGGEQGQG